MQMREIENTERNLIEDVVSIRLATFQGFFLSFMGRGFLRQMYRSFCCHKDSGLLVAFENEKPVGFLAYSSNISGLYKLMIRKRIIPFARYSLVAFFRKLKVFMKLFRAFSKPSETKRKEACVELASIGVSPDAKSKGIGKQLIDELKKRVDFIKYSYITLETDALNNEGADHFYQKNGFIIEREYDTTEGRKMFEYRHRSKV